MKFPTFLILGGSRCGTTSLFNYLGQHPAIFTPSRKDPQFFAWDDMPDEWRPGHFRNGRPYSTLDEYQSLFADAGPQHMAGGEASPRYLFTPGAPKRIHDMQPNMKLIVLLREPVSRAFSHYVMNRRHGIDPARDFETAFHKEETRLQDDWDAFIFSYKTVGLYSHQLARYFEWFPREQIQIYLLEDLRDKPREVMTKLFGFLGVDPAFEVNFQEASHPGRYPRPRLEWLLNRYGLIHKLFFDYTPSRLKLLLRGIARRILPKHMHGDIGARLLMRQMPSLNDDVWSRLHPYFHDDVLRVQDLIGRDLSHWLHS